MKTMGVLGGMGPLATIDFLRKVISLTYAKRDSEHIHTIVDSRCDTPDRSRYILENDESPLSYLIESAITLQRAGADYIVMPCNTAHFFYEDIIKGIEIPFINMIEECAKDLSGFKKVGLLASEGTYFSKIYDHIFSGYSIDIMEPPEELKKRIRDVIYSIKGGNTPATEENILTLEEGLNYFKGVGADRVILGCTELPIVLERMEKDCFWVDPTEILARSAIKFAGGTLKEEI